MKWTAAPPRERGAPFDSSAEGCVQNCAHGTASGGHLDGVASDAVILDLLSWSQGDTLQPSRNDLNSYNRPVRLTGILTATPAAATAGSAPSTVSAWPQVPNPVGAADLRHLPVRRLVRSSQKGPAERYSCEREAEEDLTLALECRVEAEIMFGLQDVAGPRLGALAQPCSRSSAA